MEKGALLKYLQGGGDREKKWIMQGEWIMLQGE